MMTAVSYPDHLNALLHPAAERTGRVVDLFAGCGGLALGFAAHGFSTHGFEMDRDACGTYAGNLNDPCDQVTLTPETALPPADVVIGGPPCQPFSVNGHQKGRHDTRDGFPTFISAVARLKPALFLFENVRGIFYRNRPYFDGVVGELRSLGYMVEARLLNAVNHGVPQNRERVFVIGWRGGRFDWPVPAERRWTAGDAMGDLAGETPDDAKFLTPSMDAYVERYETASHCVTPRDLHLDRPARTLTCRNLAGATADMHRVRLSDGRRRRLSVREAARLQSFPDWFDFAGTETSRFNQIGNAVPPMIAWHLAGAVSQFLCHSITCKPSAGHHPINVLNAFTCDDVLQAEYCPCG